MFARGVVTVVAFGLVVQAQQRPEPNLYIAEKEAALGAALAKDVQRQSHPLPSPAVQQYVAAVGESLRAHLPDSTLTFTFSVIEDSPTGPMREPMALPGGYIFVPASLILDARDEAEFAGMLAHAMAHVAERHGTRAATRGQMANAGTIPLIYMGGWAGAGAAGSVLVPVGFLKDQRNYELEADRDAVRLMSAAGFDPRALVDYVARMQPPSSSRPSALPDRNVRIENLEEAIQRLPRAEYMPHDGFRAIQKQVATLMPPEAPPAPLKPPTLKRPGEK